MPSARRAPLAGPAEPAETDAQTDPRLLKRRNATEAKLRSRFELPPGSIRKRRSRRRTSPSKKAAPASREPSWPSWARTRALLIQRGGPNPLDASRFCKRKQEVVAPAAGLQE